MAASSPSAKPSCTRRVKQSVQQLLDGDELSQHRAIRDLIACETEAPAAFAEAAHATGLDAAVSSNAIAKQQLSKSLDKGIGVTLGGALLAVAAAPPVELMVLAQRWYDQATDIAEGGAYAEAATRALGRVLRIVGGAADKVVGAERERLFAETETLYKIVSRETGLAMVPPPETPAQRRMREDHMVTLRTLRDRVRTGKDKP